MADENMVFMRAQKMMYWDELKDWLNEELKHKEIECVAVYPQRKNDVTGIVKFKINGEFRVAEVSLISSVYESMDEQKVRIRKEILDPILAWSKIP